jgi:pyridoxal phosphate enzyme (YggS family)
MSFRSLPKNPNNRILKMNIAENIQQVKKELPGNVRLVAVSKFHPESAIWEAYNAGHRIFGENRVQELIAKYEHLPKDIEWHFIGHLQGNKVKYIAPFIDTVESVDSLKLLEELNREAGKSNRKINVLLQIHIAQEIQKFGFSFDEIERLLEEQSCNSFPNLIFSGLMGMATFTDDKAQIQKEFESLSVFFKKIKTNYFKDVDTFKELSIGMSDDYPLAVAAGSTLVRIGSKIFGVRLC